MRSELAVAGASGLLPLVASATPAADGMPWWVTLAATVLGPPLSLMVMRIVSATWRVPVAMLRTYAKLKRKDGDEVAAQLMESGAGALEAAAKSAPTPLAFRAINPEQPAVKVVKEEKPK